jgi:DNA-binding NarL/FixJ family response regulator
MNPLANKNQYTTIGDSPQKRLNAFAVWRLPPGEIPYPTRGHCPIFPAGIPLATNGNDVIIYHMGNVRVLLADDHAVVRSGIRHALQDLPDLEVVSEVGDGPSLITALEESRPDLLVIDVTMPDFEPVTAIRRIRARYPTMKILVVSAYDDDAYVQGLLGVGVNGYHLKDQPLSDLKLAVQRVLAGERWISSTLIGKLLSYAEFCAPSTALTDRQRELLRLLLQGLDNQSLARETGLSVKTIENHLTRLYRQLNVQSRLEAVHYAAEHPEVLNAPGLAAVADLTELLPQNRFTTLLVDDNARYRSQLRRMVGRAYPQAVIYEAENTNEAVRLVEQIMPQLVLVDVILGDEDGIRCTRRIKTLRPQSRVILISAYPDREFRRLGMEAGAAAFLDKKDLDAATMRQMIDDVLT